MKRISLFFIVMCFYVSSVSPFTHLFYLKENYASLTFISVVLSCFYFLYFTIFFIGFNCCNFDVSFFQKVELLLSRVEQAPSERTYDALLPVMKALIAPDLLRHSEIDVKVSVASCINEITRVTAPDAPYDDKQMQVFIKP